MIRYDKAARMLLLFATICIGIKLVPRAAAKEARDSAKDHATIKHYSAGAGNRLYYDVIYFESIYGNNDYSHNENKIYQHISMLNFIRNNINKLSTGDGLVDQYSFHSYKYNFNFISNYSTKTKSAYFTIAFPLIDYTSPNSEMATCLSPDKLLNIALKHGYHTGRPGLNWTAVAQYDALTSRYEIVVYKYNEFINIAAAKAINFQGMCMLTISHSLKW